MIIYYDRTAVHILTAGRLKSVLANREFYFKFPTRRRFLSDLSHVPDADLRAAEGEFAATLGLPFEVAAVSSSHPLKRLELLSSSSVLNY